MGFVRDRISRTAEVLAGTKGQTDSWHTRLDFSQTTRVALPVTGFAEPVVSKLLWKSLAPRLTNAGRNGVKVSGQTDATDNAKRRDQMALLPLRYADSEGKNAPRTMTRACQGGECADNAGNPTSLDRHAPRTRIARKEVTVHLKAKGALRIAMENVSA